MNNGEKMNFYSIIHISPLFYIQSGVKFDALKTTLSSGKALKTILSAM